MRWTLGTCPKQGVIVFTHIQATYLANDVEAGSHAVLATTQITDPACVQTARHVLTPVILLYLVTHPWPLEYYLPRPNQLSQLHPHSGSTNYQLITTARDHATQGLLLFLRQQLQAQRLRPLRVLKVVTSATTARLLTVLPWPLHLERHHLLVNVGLTYTAMNIVPLSSFLVALTPN